MKTPPPSARLSAAPRQLAIPFESARLRDPLVGRGYRRNAEPNGDADGSKKDLDRTPCQLGAPGERHSCLPFRREERPVGHHVRGRYGARRHASPHSPAGQGWHLARRAGRTGRAVPNPSRRFAGPTGDDRDWANRSPVSRHVRKPVSKCFQRLEQEGYNERRIATQRRARSAGLLSSARRPSSKQRPSAVRRPRI